MRLRAQRRMFHDDEEEREIRPDESPDGKSSARDGREAPDEDSPRQQARNREE